MILSLNKALISAKNKVSITKKEIDIVKLARKFVLEYRNKIWIRKHTRNAFDVPMEAYYQSLKLAY